MRHPLSFRKIVQTAAALSLCFSGWLQAADEKRPNVILILSDDHGFGDYGFMGSKEVSTPHLDSMAAQSLVYTRGYVMPVCSPSLACLLTGKLPHQHGITGNDLSTGPKKDRSPLTHRLLSNSLMLPKALSDAGYLTYQTGKLWNVTYSDVGFTGGMTDTAGRHGDAGLAIGRKTMKPIFDFMDQAQAAEKPFFVWYAPMLPHEPHNPPARLLEKYKGKGPNATAETYFAMVEWFDETCGELDDYLAKNHLTDNTVIIYLADNGWESAHPKDGMRGKLSPWEAGIRTPMFVRWPGKVTAERDETTLASIVDFAPTVLKMTGAKDPGDLPGLDMLDRAAMKHRKSVFVESYTHDITDLDHPAKSLVARIVIDGWSKLILPGPIRPDRDFVSAPSAPVLFDLQSDPLEKKDLAAERPDEVTRLHALQDAEWSLP